jgi:hypothetical protein
MNYNNTSSSLIDTKLLQIQTIDKQININLCKYKQAINNYLQTISSSTNNTLITVPNMDFWGSTSIQSGYVNSSDECLNMCNNNASCTGATYDKTKKYCWARSGESQLTPNNNTNAIVSLTISQVNNMKMLNNLILKLQQQKMFLLSSINDDSLRNNIGTEQEKMNVIISQLQAENNKINSLLDQQFSYKRDYTNTSLVYNKNKIFFNILFIIAIILIIVLLSIFIKNKKE